jgi:hypothetical protein
MADPTDPDRLDGDLGAFSERLIREAGLPPPDTAPTVEQVARIRARALAGVTAGTTRKEHAPMPTHALAPDGSVTAPFPAPREPGRAWTSLLATAAVVALIAVAALGLLRGVVDLPGGGDNPAPTAAPALAFSPEASPAADASCRRDQMVSVFEGEMPEILTDVPHATLEEGALTWRCGGVTEELATGVRSANGAFWPGVIVIVTEADTVRLLNIASGSEIELDHAPMLGEDGETEFVWSHGPEPWVAVPANAERTDWRIIDLRSMETMLLSDELGEPLPERTRPEFGQITGTDVAVIAWDRDIDFMAATPLADEPGVERVGTTRVLILPGSLEQRRWIGVAQYGIQSSRQYGYSQFASVSRNGELLAYTTLSDTSAPVIRVERAVGGERVVDVAVDEIDLDTKFILAGGDDPHLVYADGETARIVAIVPGAAREIAEIPAPGPDLLGFLPTADPDVVLFAHSGTSVSPVDVTTGAGTEFWRYTPPPWAQVFGDNELPQYLVRVVSAELGGTPATIQLVDPATGEVVLEREGVDAHPIQVVSFTTWLRNGGELAVVPIGYNRAVVLDAAFGETWEIAAPVDDDRTWRFVPSYDGRFVTAFPEPPVGTSDVDQGDTWVAPLEPDAEWVPVEGGGDAEAMAAPATPAG